MNVEIGSQEIKDHYQWLEEQLQLYSKNSSVAWLGIVLHHPVLIEPSLKSNLLPLLRKHTVNFPKVGSMFEYTNIGFDEALKYPGESYGVLLTTAQTNRRLLMSMIEFSNLGKERIYIKSSLEEVGDNLLKSVLIEIKTDMFISKIQ
jgi:hypothetical protein